MKRKRSHYNLLLPILLGLCICNRCISQKKEPVKVMNSCTLSLTLAKRVDVISSDSLSSIIKRSEDKCNFQLIDSMIVFFLRKGDSLSYKYLGALASCCDGYLTDYFIEKIGLVYRKKFSVFFDFLYFDHKRGGSVLADILVEYWSSEASLSESPNQAVRKIKIKATQNLLSKGSDKSDKRKYLDSLLLRINPNYLD